MNLQININQLGQLLHYFYQYCIYHVIDSITDQRNEKKTPAYQENIGDMVGGELVL